MSQAGFTPIQLYHSTTAAAAPSAGNLANGELAVNITDGKLYYKDNLGVVQTLASKGAGTIGGSTTQVQYNLSGALAGSANLTFDGTSLTLGGNPILSGGTANGVAYLNGSKVLTTGSALAFDGSNLETTGNTTLANNKSFRIRNTGGTAQTLLTLGNDDNVYMGQVSNPTAGALFAYAAQHIYVVGASEGMRLTSTGLGIGTSSPASKLHVNAASGSVFAQISSGANDLYLGYDSVNGMQTMQSDTGIYFSTGASFTERMRLDSSGNVGIGTSSPATKLNVSGSGNQFIRLETTSGAQCDWVTTSSDTYFGPRTNTALAFQTNNAERMRLDSSGNLGLGTSSPKANAGYATFTLNNATNGGVVQYCQGDTTIGQLFFDGNGGTLRTSSATSLVFGTNNTERARITSAGNLGVGTTDEYGRVNIQRFTSAPQSTLSIGDFATASNDVGIYLRTTGTAGISTAGGPIAFYRGGPGVTESARITSGGYFKASDSGTYTGSTAAYAEFYQSGNNAGLLVNTVNASFAAETLALRANRNTTNNSFYAIGYYNDAAAEYKLLVADSGTVTNRTGSYGTISDAKMKIDIVDAGSQWEDIKAVRFRKFKMKNDPSGLLQLGVVAQELEQTSPGLVDEHTDRDAEGNDLGTTTKSVRTSVLLMKAAVALQEAMARIEKLEAEVAALKGTQP